MKPNIIHRIAVCLTALALPFMVACSSQEECMPDVGGTIQAVMSIDLGDMGYRDSRATPSDGEYNRGSGLENFIDLPNKDFRCYLFGLDNVLVSDLDIVSVVDFGDGRYSVRLRLEDNEDVKRALTDGCRFVFVANWGTYIEPTPGMTIGELCSAPFAKFDFSQQTTQLSYENPIPMYGVKEFNNGVQDFIDGKEVSDIGAMFLLRAYAKVDVNLIFEDFEDLPVVTSVTLTRSSNKGYKAPANVTEQGQYVTGSWHTDYTPVNIPDDADDTELLLTRDDVSGHYIAYVPEFKNVNDIKEPVDAPSRIRIRFTVGDTSAGGREGEGYVDFRYTGIQPADAKPGQYFNIARNNWYKFDVTAKGNHIDWTVDVIPFTSIALDTDLGLKREDFTGYIVGKDEEGRPCWYDPAESPSGEPKTPYYLRTEDASFVTINNKEYLLVYTDYERTPKNLNHVFEKATHKKHVLTPEGITGYKYKDNMYLNPDKKRVWLDIGGNPNGTDDEKSVYEALKKVNLVLHCPGILYEWDRQEWDYARWWGLENYHPRFLFDLLGNRHPWSEGDTDEERREILGEWVNYLE